jgi:hypothetical protein
MSWPFGLHKARRIPKLGSSELAKVAVTSGACQASRRVRTTPS